MARNPDRAERPFDLWEAEQFDGGAPRIFGEAGHDWFVGIALARRTIELERTGAAWS